ncbi:MAG: hypothetical protein ACT4OM_09075 [Actinomycetota bacterium]
MAEPPDPPAPGPASPVDRPQGLPEAPPNPRSEARLPAAGPGFSAPVPPVVEVPSPAARPAGPAGPAPAAGPADPAAGPPLAGPADPAAGPPLAGPAGPAPAAGPAGPAGPAPAAGPAGPPAGIRSTGSVTGGRRRVSIGSIVTTLRRRPDLLTFLVGSLIFAGGLAMVLGPQLADPGSSRLISEREASPVPKPHRIGPDLGEPVAPYIQRKKNLAAERSNLAGGELAYGIVVFDSYRKASEVGELMQARDLEVLAIQTRIPVASFQPRSLALNGLPIVEVAAEETLAVTRDMQTLQGVAAAATDAGFRAVYQRQVELQREALGHLGDDPTTVFAVVVKGTNAMIARTAGLAQVRYVDLPDNPTATPEDSTYAALIPEDEEAVTATAR